MPTWIILAPEYPPAIGGISDYVAQLVAGLAAAGDEIELFAPAPAAPSSDARVRVHELARGYDRKAWHAIHAVGRERPDAVTLVQYLPFLFSHPGRLRHLLAWRGPLWVMFHEAAYPFERGQALRHRALAMGTHLAARALVARADRVLVSTPGCESALEKFGRASYSAIWLPIPSNLSRLSQQRTRDVVLRELGLDPEAPVVGHFSAFGSRVAEILESTLKLVVTDEPRAQVLLVGQGSEEFARRFVAQVPNAAARIHATGRVSSERAAEAIDASDVLLFPYPDGISSRRTTVMAGLAFGKAIVTNSGANTESVWARERCVELCPLDPVILAERVRLIFVDAERRSELGARAERVYATRFALERVVETLRGLRGEA